MKAYAIDSDKREVKTIDIHMQPNTVYSFFNSILIDELNSLQGHTIHADANALSEGKKPFFMGEQLIVGDALVIGKDDMSEVDAWILQKDLQDLINYEVPTFYIDVLELLKNSDINLYRLFSIDNEEKTELNMEWVLYVFSIANSDTQEYFLNELKKALDSQDDIQVYIEKMAKLAFQAAK